MKFFKDTVCQAIKHGHRVCGDTYQYERSSDGNFFVLCDGIGSGAYANNAAIVCASRLTELYRCGTSPRSACELVAESMHRARREDIPFSAFTAVLILPDGHFTVYTYESPPPILYSGGYAAVLAPRFYTVGFEVVGETTGTLEIGDSLMFTSDGVTQAGLGHDYPLGIGAEGIARFINRLSETALPEIVPQVMALCRRVSGDRYEDDTSLAVVHCREAREITLLTGPPSRKSLDKPVAESFMAARGAKVVCGSTTIDILCREMSLTPEMAPGRNAFGTPPEYLIPGVDIATEGAIMLNQVYNILDEPADRFMEGSAPERLCVMLLEADVVNIIAGDSLNEAHDALLFKQIGIRPRRQMLKLIEEKLREKGKMVLRKRY